MRFLFDNEIVSGHKCRPLANGPACEGGARYNGNHGILWAKSGTFDTYIGLNLISKINSSINLVVFVSKLIWKF